MSVSNSLKIYRNVYVKGFKKFPYQMLTGRATLMYTGKVVCGCDSEPNSFDKEKDLYIDCDCDYSKWKQLKKIFL